MVAHECCESLKSKIDGWFLIFAASPVRSVGQNQCRRIVIALADKPTQEFLTTPGKRNVFSTVAEYDVIWQTSFIQELTDQVSETVKLFSTSCSGSVSVVTLT